MSLARVRRERADPTEALELLTACCDLFPAGSDFADLRIARMLRDDIRGSLNRS